MALDHLGYTVSDDPAARRFYDAALGAIGITPLMTGDTWCMYGRDRAPFLWIGAGDRVAPPIHVAFRVTTKADVAAFHAAGRAAGGTDHGGPGFRPQYHPGYYGAFLLDPDGHNVEAVAHGPTD